MNKAYYTASSSSHPWPSVMADFRSHSSVVRPSPHASSLLLFITAIVCFRILYQTERLFSFVTCSFVLFRVISCCCFSTGTLQGDECSQANPGIIQLDNCTMASLRKAVGEFVTPFVLESCFDYSCSVELAGSYSGHASTSSGKFV